MDPFYIKLYSKDLTNSLKIDIVNAFYALQQGKKFGSIDKILSEININRIEDDIIILIIRCNKLIANKLQFWQSFTEKVLRKVAKPADVARFI